MLLRIRSNMGVWRVDGLDEAVATVSDVLEGIASSRPHVVYEKPLSKDPSCTQPLDTTQTLSEQGLSHGAMVYCRVDPSTTVDVTMKPPPVSEAETEEEAHHPHTNPDPHQHMRRIIDKDGAIKLVPSNEVGAPGKDKGFRKGMLPLRDMKMHWTLAEFNAMDSQFTFKIQRQAEAVCKQVSLDVPSIQNFQAYCQRFQFQRKRFGICYGKFVPVDPEAAAADAKEDKKDDGTATKKIPQKAIVEAIYEPPQQVDAEAAEGFVVLDDPMETQVDEIASLLGLRRVGWILCHEPREPGFVLSAAEVIMAAEYQLEAAGGQDETPFVTIKVFPGQDGHVSVEAFQVSQQCMSMVAEEALQITPDDPKVCTVNPTFTAIQEGKESKTVENNFFLTVVPIVQHTSETFIADFPRANRDLDDRVQSHDEMKRQLQKAGQAGWTFEDRLSDFNLLIYLAKFLDIKSDFPKICQSVKNHRTVPLDDGYKLIIKSMAGLDGSY